MPPAPTEATEVAVAESDASDSLPPASDEQDAGLEDWNVESVDSETEAVIDDPVLQSVETVWQLPASVEDAMDWLEQSGASLDRDYDDNALTKIDMAFLRVTDEQLQVLSLFPELRELDLTGTDVSDDGLGVLGDLLALESIKLRGTAVTDVSLAHFAGLKSVRILDLSRTQITDDGLQTLLDLPDLRYLLLNHTAVTDQGLVSLSELKSLRGINLIGTQATEEGISRLQSLLPECVIISATSEDLSAVRPPEIYQPAETHDQDLGAVDREQAAQFRQLVVLARERPELAEQLAAVCAGKAQWNEAAAILKDRVAVETENVDLYLMLAEALVHSGRRGEATEMLAPIVGEAAANRKIGTMIIDRALVTSEEYLKRSLELDPSDSRAREQLQFLRLQRDRRTQVESSWTDSSFSDWTPQVKPGNHDNQSTTDIFTPHVREPQLPWWQQARMQPASWSGERAASGSQTAVPIAPGYLRR